MRRIRHLTHIASRLSRPSLLEAEQKFKPSESSLRALIANAGEPKFRSLTRAQNHSFEDVYYDTNDVLSDNGIWVRLRNGEWEAKCRHAGDYTSSHFEELSGKDAVAQLVSQHLPRAKLQSHSASGIGVLAKFTTNRQSWKAEGQFTIVVDDTDFGHRVGEVELTENCAEESTVAEKRVITERLHSQLDRFMETHRWAFPAGKVAGKLSAYFALQNEGNGQHLNSLQQREIA